MGGFLPQERRKTRRHDQCKAALTLLWGSRDPVCCNRRFRALGLAIGKPDAQKRNPDIARRTFSASSCG
jgi:hypothetical protein